MPPQVPLLGATCTPEKPYLLDFSSKDRPCISVGPSEDSLPADLGSSQPAQAVSRPVADNNLKQEEHAVSSHASYTSESFKEAKSEAMEAFEKCFLEKTLNKHRWNITEAAEASGVNRKTFQRLIAKYNIK